MRSAVKQKPQEKAIQKYGKIQIAISALRVAQKKLFLMITMNHQEQVKLYSVCSIYSSHQVKGLRMTQNNRILKQFELWSAKISKFETSGETKKYLHVSFSLNL